MDKRHYKGRRTTKYRHNSARNRGTDRQNSYFFIKANICLGVIICTLAAVSLESEKAELAAEKLSALIGTNMTGEELAEKGSSIIAAIKGDGGIYTFAGEKEHIKLNDEILAEIDSRSGIYEQNNKGAPQNNGSPLSGE